MEQLKLFLNNAVSWPMYYLVPRGSRLNLLKAMLLAEEMEQSGLKIILEEICWGDIWAECEPQC